jgi:hypothetical protein
MSLRINFKTLKTSIAILLNSNMDGFIHKLHHDQIATKAFVGSFVRPYTQPFEFVCSG